MFEKTLSMKNKPSLSLVCVLMLLYLAFSPVHAALPAVTAEGDALPSLAPMLEKTSPAVVNIAIETRVRAARNPLMDDPFFRRSSIYRNNSGLQSAVRLVPAPGSLWMLEKVMC